MTPGRRTIWILGDQLAESHTALAAADPARDVVLMVESRGRGAHRRYHCIKLVMIYAAMRHFAERLRRGGWTVDYHALEDTSSFAEALAKHGRRGATSEVWLMEPNSLREREWVEEACRGAGWSVRYFPTCQFLVTRSDFAAFAKGRKRLLMENHYRETRVKYGILLDKDGGPEGGAWNFDAENRRTQADWRRDGAPAPPPWPQPSDDPVVKQVTAEVDRWFPEAFGRAEAFWPPVTRAAALACLAEFVRTRLPRFGSYQDLMLSSEPGMFHSWISAPLNIGLLEPMECVEAAVSAWRNGKAPLAAVEGFVRQIIGWREFVNGVYWLKMPEYWISNGLKADRPLPAFFYSGETDLECLRLTLGEVHRTAYNHHIQRLMILGNFLLLAGVSPQQALDWFLEMYVDAFDWVMAANVLGMALHADGGFMATKPYAASAAYISKMSDYCANCRYRADVKSGPEACPFNLLYWDFFNRHAREFGANPRIGMIVRSWLRRPETDRKKILGEAEKFLGTLG